MKPFFPATAWKFLLVSLALLLLALNLWAATNWRRAADPAVAGTLAASFADASPGVLQVTEMALDSPLRKAGVAVGDRVRFDHTGDRARVMGVDEVISLTHWRGGVAERLEVRPIPDADIRAAPRPALVGFMLEVLPFSLWNLLLGVIVVLRLGRSPVMAAFALAMICESVDSCIFNMPGGALQTSLRHLRSVTVVGSFLGFLYFALRYAGEQAPWRHAWVRRAFYAYGAVYLCVGAYRGAFQAGLLPAASPPLVEAVFPALAAASTLAIWGALGWSWAHTTGVVRQRLAWIGVSMGVVYGMFLLAILWVPVLGTSAGPWANSIAMVVLMAANAGLAYGLLRHRLFDIGFAINRTVVFTILSTLLLVVFAITEFAVDKLLHFEGREKNIIFDAIVALGVILTFHRIQHWVGHQVDHTFFRKWHEAAKTLRHAMDKAAHISDGGVLLERVAQAMDAFTEGAGFAIYRNVADSSAGAGFELQHGTLEGAPALLGPNEDAVLETRTAASWVYLDDAAGEARGAAAFPMLTRGGLQGLAIVGDKGSGALYRPDELALLAQSVQLLGQYLEVLRADALARHAQAEQQRAEALSAELQARDRETLRLQKLLELRLSRES